MTESRLSRQNFLQAGRDGSARYERVRMSNELSRRDFLKRLAAASSVAAAGGLLGVFAGDTYYMRPGETLSGLNMPAWARIMMADDCVIEHSIFGGTQIEARHAKNVLILNCQLMGSEELPPGTSLVRISNVYM